MIVGARAGVRTPDDESDDKGCRRRQEKATVYKDKW
jgi:hypothetical protein